MERFKLSYPSAAPFPLFLRQEYE